MCSINISLKDPKQVSEMNKKTIHRGIWKYEKEVDGVGLGHVRLPIQGLDERFACPYKINGELYLFNGEIYNYKELKKGASSDVQVLDLDPRLFDGDFAIVKISKDLIDVVTDRFGKRQLYYRIEDGKLTGISSEIKGLVEKNDGLDMYYLSTVAKFGYFFNGDNTIVKNIKRFLPGKRYTIRNSEIYSTDDIKWDSSLLVPKNVDKTDIVKLIRLSVKRRLVSDVPIALLYSGGLDSSIALYHLNEYKKNLDIFTIENLDDLMYAKRYAGSLGLVVNELNIKETDNIVPHLFNESASDLGSVIPNYLLFKEIKKKGFRVCMTSDAADEIFSGYKRNKEFDYQQHDIFNELVWYHFPRLDKLAMANTVEYRSPFSADYVIDFALSVKYRQRINKNYLRKAYSDLLPSYIVNREKIPLKTDQIRNNKEVEKLRLIKLWEDRLFDLFKSL